MRALVTGATGFIGSHVTRLLINEGCTVFALLRDNANTWRINDVLSSVRIVRGDIRCMSNVEKAVVESDPDVCFHLAWHVLPGNYESLANLDMVTASLQLAHRLAAKGCKKFVGIGSCFEYDTDIGYLSETSPTKPRTLYGSSKLAVSLVLQKLSQLTEMKTAWLRLFYLFGPFEDKRRLVPHVITSLLSDKMAIVTKGEQVRDFLHVEDVASAIWNVGQNNVSGVLNVGSGKPVTVREIVTKIGEILDRVCMIKFGAIPYSASDPMFICANNRKLLNHTDWASRYDLQEGLKHTISWWKRSCAYWNP
jgi:nucleoside-diphosphate-sugar epimerase